MASKELTDLSIKNAPPQISEEGLAAKNRIAQARANKNAGGVRQGATIAAPVVASSTTPVITPSSLEPATPPVVSPVPLPTEQTKLQADLTAQTEDALAQKVAQDKMTAEAGKTTALQAYLDQLKTNKGLTQLTSEAYAQAGGVNDITPELNDINDQIRREQRSLDLAKRNITERGGGLEMGANAEIGNLERVSLQKQADLSIIQMAVQGRYDSAKEIADRAVSAQFEAQTIANDIAKFDYEENRDLFTTAEQREYDLLFSDRERKLEEAQKNKQDMYDLGLQASADGAPSSVVQRMFAAKTREEALAIGGSYIGRLQRLQAEATLQGAYLSNQQKQAEIDAVNNTYSGEFASAIDAASNLVGAERGKTSRKAIESAVGSGDYATAYALIANNVEEALTGDVKTKFSNARTDYSILSNMRTAIEQYQAAGGDTGFLKGTVEQIARRFGELKSDPQFSALAVQLEREFQSYRQNMTGAAFSPGESREYGSVNPRTTASLDLNLATIDGAMNQLENRISSTINTRVPGADKLYQAVSGGVEVDDDPATAPVGSVVSFGDEKYKKVGDNAYEPI